MFHERTSYVPKPGRFDAVLALRHRACVVRREIGLAGGEVYVEADDGGGPQVHWECRFANPAEQAADLAARAASPAFAAVRDEMHHLIDGFERRLYVRAAAPGAVVRDVATEGHPVAPQELRFVSDGRDLAGFLHLPPGAGPFACMVINHGSGIDQGTTELCRPGVMALLAGWGIASFLPHRRGYGNSPGRPWREDVSADYGTEAYDAQLAQRLQDEAGDVIAARDFVTGLDLIDAAHVGVMGSSFGGTVTLLAAARCPEFRCAVEFAGAAMNWERAPGLRRVMLDAAGELTQPVFFIQAANDYSTAPTRELAASLEGSGKVVESRVFPAFGISRDEGHFFYREGPLVWGGAVRRFLERWL
jgi:pimeloyl-ACP methyl ester carboxylesterase